MSKKSIYIFSACGLLALGALSFLIFGGQNPNKEKDPEINLPAQLSSEVKSFSAQNSDSLTWDYNESSNTLVISGKGPMRSYLDTEPAWNYLSSKVEKIEIGSEVTSIGDGAFMYFESLKDVHLGSSVTYIGTRAFDFCTSLREINFPASLKYIASYALNNTLLHSTSGFILPQGLVYVGNSAFYSAFKESFVSIPASLEYIGDTAFGNCFVSDFRVEEGNPSFTSLDGSLYDKNLTTLYNYPADKTSTLYETPKSLKTIKKDAIAVTGNLKKIVIAASVDTIESQSIYWNYGLQFIEVSEENQNYQSIDGVLLSKDGKILISYPLASDRTAYTVPASTEILTTYSLSGAKNLKKITLEEGVKSLNRGALFSNSSLEELHLPKSLESIEEYALEYEDNLKLIVYASQKSDWDKIKIADKNSSLTSPSLKITYKTK